MWNKSKEAQTTVITTLSHIYQLSTIKGKFKSREERYKDKITPRHVIEEETEKLGEKSLHNPPSRSRFTREYSWSTWITKDPSSLVYHIYLSPLSSCYQLASRNLIFSTFQKSHNSAQLHPLMNGSFQYFSTAQKSHLTLRMGVVSVWAINLSMI